EGVTRLVPGDFVEAEVEFVVIPAEPGTYYGRNAAFREHLEAHIGRWEPVHRLASANRLSVEAETGTVLRSYPVEIIADERGAAAVTIRGGAGYVPIVFRGLASPDGVVIEGAGSEA